ncbi:MAG: transporter [Ignavibacteria bacterium]|nr:transporter [Ignavibacteria bacterium]
MIIRPVVLQLALIVVSCAVSFSQEIEPRAYSNLPVNANFAALNYNFTSGNIVADPAAPIKELDLNSNNIIGGYVRTFSMFGNLARIQLTVPYSFLSGTAKLAGRDTAGTRSGLADLRIRFGINFIGSPAMDIAEYVKRKEGTVVGASLVVSAPTGQYFEDKLINLGTNRWGFKPEIGISQRLSDFYGEIYTGVWFFTANNEYVKTNKLETDPLFNIQGQINYVFKNIAWAGINAAYSNGGNTSVNGVSNNTKQDNWRLGAVVSSALSKNLAVKLQYHTGAVIRRGSDFDFYGISFQYFWY